MTHAAGALLAALLTLTTPLAMACFPTPDAKRTSKVSELSLAEPPFEPVVIYTAGKYEIHMTPRDLLQAMRAHGREDFGAGTFAGRLQSLLPLDASIDTREILAPLAPETPEAKERSERALRYRRFWRQSDRQLGYVIAELLEQGLAAVVERSTGKPLASIRRNEYSELCFGGRKFIAGEGDGDIILSTSDWVS